MMRLILVLLPFALLWPEHRAMAQTDSSFLLTPERLTEKDVVFKDNTYKDVRIISGTRTLESVDRLPFTTWVITSEDILRNGFVTLADVLRAAPGIRVSQPGNAEEGETFLMRGLRGNQYVKIMINDVPIKPGLALGMPIGAQLPVRQAERIEVVYGAASAIYANEACAGVVNIILKETERPVYTQADLSFGSFGYNSLDLMFGGKLGRDKNIFRYSIYGSNTIRARTDVEDKFGHFDNFNTPVYVPFQMSSEVYSNNPNYQKNVLNGIPVLAPMSHESRLFGLSLRWRGFDFTWHRMGRSDAYALGRNPLSTSYGNPANQLIEKIDYYSLGFARRRTKTAFLANISVNFYQVNPNSGATFVFDRLSSAAYYIREKNMPGDPNTLNILYERYASNTRYAFATALDFRQDIRYRVRLRPRLHAEASYISTFGNGFSINHYLKEPEDLGLIVINFNNDTPFYSAGGFIGDINLSGQLEWQGEKLSLLAALSFAPTVNLEQKKRLVPRLGAVYRIDSNFTLRAAAGLGYRIPSPYYIANSYQFYVEKERVDRADVNQGANWLQSTETTRSLDAALKYRNGGFSAEGVYYYQEARNLVRGNYFRNYYSEEFQDEVWRYGYENYPGLAQKIWGLQLFLRSEDRQLVSFGGRKKETRISSKWEFYAQYCRGREWYGEGQSADEPLNQPRWHTQFRTFFNLGKNTEIMLASNRQTSVLNWAHTYAGFYQLLSRPEGFRSPKFRSWDMNVRLFLSKQFLVYLNIQNVFNKKFAGLDATGTVDDLLYNIQPGRSIRFGVNYNMN